MNRNWIAAAALIAVALTAAPAQAAPVTERRGLEFARPDGEALLLDAYLPPGGRPWPGVIVVHGGSWVSGSRADAAELARELAGAGLAAFAIDHRLAPEHPYPAAVLDAQAAVRWVRGHAEELGVDPGALGVVGTSAGGHIAAMVGVLGTGPRDRGARVRAAVSLSGPMDLTTLVADAPSSHRDALQRLTQAFLGCHCPERAAAASPIGHVDATDAALLLVGGTSEVVGSEQSRRMGSRLAEHGVPHRLIEVPGPLHAVQYLDVPVPAADGPIGRAVAGFLTQWTPGPRSAPVPDHAGPSPLARAAGLGGLALLAIVAALAPLAAERRRSVRAIRLVAFDPAALARIDALGRTPARRSEISALLSHEGFGHGSGERIPA